MMDDPCTARPTADAVCRAVYLETAAFYAQRRPRVSGEDLGFRILYGPPVVGAPYLFIGAQPGGGPESRRADQMQGWPPACEYALDGPALAIAGWNRTPYAVNMQKIWGVAVLERCTGLNANFFRAPSHEAWRRVEPAVRAELERFSIERVGRIVGALRPGRIVVIGLSTFDRLLQGCGEPVVTRNGRSLLSRATCGASRQHHPRDRGMAEQRRPLADAQPLRGARGRGSLTMAAAAT